MKTGNPSSAPTINFRTFGCKVNQYDTQSIREAFLSNGFSEVSSEDSPDYFLVNTCTVTANAEKKCCNLIRRYALSSPHSKIIVTGCMVKKDSARLSQSGKIAFLIDRSFFPEKINSFKGHTRAFLKVQDGCNNICSYCKVRLVRGASRSRQPAEIIDEARKLAKEGFKEIVLTGICLGAYGKDLLPKCSLVKLLKALEALSGILRIRLSSIEAGDVSEGLIATMQGSKKICPHLHIPVQSGDDKVLKSMHRKYTSLDYSRLVKKIRKKIPGIAITTDVLVGFPGEGKVNFKNTVRLLKEIKPLKVHIFPYSKREGTAAAGLKTRVSREELDKRVAELERLSQSLGNAYKKRFYNTTRTVLVERRLEPKPGFWEGFTDNYIRVRFKSGCDLKNRLIPLKLNRLNNA